jgi:hypothetical protein
MPARCGFGRSCGRTAGKEEEMSDEYKAWLAALKPGGVVAMRGASVAGGITHVESVYPPSLIYPGGMLVTRSGWKFSTETGTGIPFAGFTIVPPCERDRMIARHVDLQREIQHAWEAGIEQGEELPDAELAEMVSRMERALAVLMGR